MPQVVCTCRRCRQHSFTIFENQTVNGKLVSSATRTKHWSEDQALPPESSSVTGTNENVNSTVGGVESMSSVFLAADVDGDSLDTRNSQTYASVVTLVCILASWLHLACGLSRATTTRVLKFIQIIVHTLVDAPLVSPPRLSNDVFPRLPSDVRTAISHLSLEPRIIRYICCPKCFHPYSLEDRAESCTWKETSRSRVCGEELWAIRSTRGGPKAVPRRLYTTQDFESWLGYFLSRPGIEDLIDASYNHIPAPSGVMSDIWDSPAWLSLGSFTRTHGNLTFSFYIDWFNPFMNKIAGKTVSCGAIMMFCLNLPYHLRHRPENTFFAGITPPPHEPSVTTITSLLDPLVARFQDFYLGKLVLSHRHPAGVIKRVAILPAIGDLPAIRKALGFAGIASHHICTFCDIRKSDIEELDKNNWKARVGVNVIAAAEKWRQASTKQQRKAIFDKYGVRWSPFHQLSYRDPVQHTVLGVMHNWLEGILQHHVRTKWGIGMGEETQSKDKKGWNQSNDDDVEMLDAEILELEKDSQMNEDIPLHTRRLQSSNSMLEINPDDEGSDDSDFLSPNISDEESESTSSEFPSSTCIFNAAHLSQIRKCITNSTLPSWIDRPPHNLGEKSHGKLKADHWFTLITIFFPLILPEIWSTLPTSRSKKLLNNLHNLVTCTHIVGSYTTSTEMVQIFEDHYFQYRESSRWLFPNVPARPNHHYAMHIPDLLCFWGPLIKLSEFPYERHNGLLQSINTNKHMWELDFTMLSQVCRRGRLTGLVEQMEHASNGGPLDAALTLIGNENQMQDTFSLFNLNRKRTRIPTDIYDQILIYCQFRQPEIRRFDNFPHPTNALVLSPWAYKLSHFSHKTRLYSTVAVHPGNSSISFRRGTGIIDFGQIVHIWAQSDSDAPSTEIQIYLLVLPFERLSPVDLRQQPYQPFPGFKCCVVYTASSAVGGSTTQGIIVGVDQLVGHVASYGRPPGTFGIPRAVTVLVDGLSRNRS